MIKTIDTKTELTGDRKHVSKVTEIRVSEKGEFRETYSFNDADGIASAHVEFYPKDAHSQIPPPEDATYNGDHLKIKRDTKIFITSFEMRYG